MTFHPRLLRPGDELPDDAQTASTAGGADGDADLPDDLAMLAAQLRSDAAHLADCFPAQAQWRTLERIDRQRQWLRATAAAVLVAGLGLWTLRIWQRPHHASPATDATVVQVVEEPGLGRAIEDSAAPAVWLRTLTSGEQEGVLDLLEEDSQAGSSVSI